MAENNKSSEDMKLSNINVDNDSDKNNLLEVRELKRKAMENYSAFLESLDSNCLENEAKNPSFERNTEKSGKLVEGILNYNLISYPMININFSLLNLIIF